MDYLRQLDPAAPSSARQDCIFCDAAACDPGSNQARQRLVLLQDEHGVMLLNKYPYTNGHLLIASNEHVQDLNALRPSQRGGLIELAAMAQRLLETAINPQGFNVGINLGACAGAGIPGHLHLHVVPRWRGDTNFMQVFGNVRVIPQALEESYQYLAQTLTKMS